MVTIPTSTTAQETENTQLSSLSQTSEGGNFISMETRPVVMVTESALQSVQDGQGIVTEYQDNSRSFLGNGDEKLAAQNTQSYTPSQQATVQPPQNDTPYATNIPSPEVPQEVSVSMETASEEAKEHMPTNENSLKTAEGEQSIQDYCMETACTETANNSEQMNMSLMFESGQQLTEEEASGVPHSNAVPTVNNATAVFTQ